MRSIILILSLFMLGVAPAHRWIDVEASAYCPCAKCTNGDGVTASGRDASLPGVAVDGKFIRRGEHLDIPGYKRGPNANGSWILADDTGGAMRQAAKRGKVLIDVRFASHQEALNWGRQWIRVRVWEK